MPALSPLAAIAALARNLVSDLPVLLIVIVCLAAMALA